MDRTTLESLLSSGPSRKFDICGRLSELRDDEVSVQPLFDTDFLNQCIVFKFYDEHDRHIKQIQAGRFPTLIYFPYDTERPHDGGESFFFAPSAWQSFFYNKTDGRPDMAERLENDYAKLSVFGEVPTLSPFLLSEAFERNGHEVDDRLLALPPEIKARIRERLYTRLRPLVVAAFGQSRVRVGSAVETFVTKIVENAEDPQLHPLVEALRINPDQAPETFISWTGITYFEYEFHVIQQKVGYFIQWLRKYPLPRENLPREQRIYFREAADRLLRQVRKDWGDARTILSEYADSYAKLLTERKPNVFVAFLSNARYFYWQLGDILGRLEQICLYWDKKAQRYNHRAFPYAVSLEFYEIMNQSYQHRPASGTGGAGERQGDNTQREVVYLDD